MLRAKKQPLVLLSARVEPTLLKRFEKVASANDRSVAAELRRAAERHVENEETRLEEAA